MKNLLTQRGNRGGKPTGRSMKNLLTQQGKLRRKTDQRDINWWKTSETNDKNEGKNRLLTQWEPRRKTDPKVEPLGHCFLAFLLEPLVGGRPRFRLAYLLRGRAVGGRAIVGRAIGGATSMRGEIILEHWCVWNWNWLYYEGGELRAIYWLYTRDR